MMIRNVCGTLKAWLLNMACFTQSTSVNAHSNLFELKDEKYAMAACSIQNPKYSDSVYTFNLKGYTVRA